jgi:hypothetical protein
MIPITYTLIPLAIVVIMYMVIWWRAGLFREGYES